MPLKDFIKTYVKHNTIIRLWTPNDEGTFTMLYERDDDGVEHEVGMEHQILNDKGWQAKYANWKVICIADILCETYMEAVNIVITEYDHWLLKSLKGE